MSVVAEKASRFPDDLARSSHCSYTGTMKRTHTSQLFYGRYPYRITIIAAIRNEASGSKSTWTVSGCKKWLQENAIDHKIRASFGGIRRRYKSKPLVLKCNLFLRNRDDVDRCLGKWPTEVDSIVEPLADSHVAYLENNTATVIRKKLTYGKFRYVVRFGYRYDQSADGLHEWVKQTFLDRPASDPPIKYRHSRWWPILYLADESDLVLTKLSWNDAIKTVTIIRTYDELHQPSST